MSTYLVAFVICDYSQEHTKTDNGVPVSVYSPEVHTPHTSFILKTASQILNYFDNFFGVSFPLPKLGKYT